MPKYPLVCPETILEGTAYSILSEWYGVREPIKVTVSGCQCEVTVIVRPLGIPIVGSIGEAPMTECERDVIDTLKDAGRSLTTSKIIDAMIKAGKLHGESTVVKALARMVKLGALQNKGRRSGYSLPPMASPS